MIVDDESSVVDTLAATIPWSDLGIHGVFKAYSGEEALKLAEASPIHIVITDIRMPGMDGIALLKRLKLLSKKTRSIVLSGYAEFAYAQDAIQLHASAYLLKPVSDGDLIEKLREIVHQIHQEWERIASQDRAEQTLRANMPLLREALLHDMLSNKLLVPDLLTERMKLLDIPFAEGQEISLMLIRLESAFGHLSDFELSLMRYSVGNIAEEILSEHYVFWLGKDRHEHLIFVIAPHPTAIRAEGDADPQILRRRLEMLAIQIQDNVELFLRGNVSIVISQAGRFPMQISDLHKDALSAIRTRFGADQGLFLSLTDTLSPMMALKSLYEPPLLLHLLEEGRWEAAAARIEEVFGELRTTWAHSQEHLQEVFYNLSNAFSYISHRNGKQLPEMLGEHYAFMEERRPFRTIESLRQWAVEVINKISRQHDDEKRTMRAALVADVKAYIQEHLAEDISLQSIADHVHFHPVYISKVFKLETKTNLSDYLLETRMEKAAYLLKHSAYKIYEIAAGTGYQHAGYFTRVFKKQYGMTPQEYRDRTEASP